MAHRSLGWEIGGLLAAKAILLAVLYFAFFAHPVTAQPSATAAHILGAR